MILPQSLQERDHGAPRSGIHGPRGKEITIKFQIFLARSRASRGTPLDLSVSLRTPWAADQPLKKSYLFLSLVGPVLRFAKDSAPSLQLGRFANACGEGQHHVIYQSSDVRRPT
jgi:hypothetical protein